MKAIAVAIAASLVAGSAIAGPLDGVGRQLDRNGGFDSATTFSGAEHKDGVVSISGSAIGTDISSGGVHANSKSVVGTTADTGNTGGTRVNLSEVPRSN